MIRICLLFRFWIFQCVLHALHTFLLHLYKLAATYMIWSLSLIHLSALTPRYKSWNCVSFIKSIMHWQIHFKQRPFTRQHAIYARGYCCKVWVACLHCYMSNMYAELYFVSNNEKILLNWLKKKPKTNQRVRMCASYMWIFGYSCLILAEHEYLTYVASDFI